MAFSRDGLMWGRPQRSPCFGMGEDGSGAEGGVHCWRSGLVVLPDGT